MRTTMTIDEIIQCPKEMLSAKDVSEVLGMDAGRVIEYARINEFPRQLPFRYMFSGKRLKIPKRDFLRFVGLSETPEDGFCLDKEIR